MPNLLIRGLPDDVHSALQRRASMHGCSLQDEVRSILAGAVGKALNAKMTAPVLHVSNAPLLGKLGRKQIYGDGPPC